MSHNQTPHNILCSTGKMTLTYVVSLTLIGCLSLWIHLLLTTIIDEQSHSATLINMSGQQRMLSQRIALFSTEYLATGSQQAKQIAQQSLIKMQKNNAMLLNSHNKALKLNSTSPLSHELQQLYFAKPYQLEARLQHFTILVEKALNTAAPLNFQAVFNDKKEVVSMAKNVMLSTFDKVVNQYEKESLEKISALHNTQELVFLLNS